MGGKMTAIIPTFWLLGLPDLLSSEHCETGYWADVSPHASVGKEAMSKALKESREQKFCISHEPEVVTCI